MASVTIDQGRLFGGKATTDNNVVYYEFMGIPYAKPPIGNLRFKSPQPPEPWVGQRDATSCNKNNISLQNYVNNEVIGSEDCLYLNVYTPKISNQKSKLPVMVFIHGGGFIFGNSTIKAELGPDYLIENDVILVTPNYRLGVLGFLSLDIPEASGNMGLKDQVQALKWVQNNIEHFGGDKSNVTLCGISAGATSVEHLMLSPLNEGLFHRAIMMSGSSLNPWSINYDLKKAVKLLLDEMGYTGSMDDVQEIYQYLFTSDALKLLDASAQILKDNVTDTLYAGFAPCIEKDFGNDDALIAENPYKLLTDGKFIKIPVIKGVSNKEGYIRIPMNPKSITDLMEKKDFLKYFAFKVEHEDEDKLTATFSEAYSPPGSPLKDDENDKLAIDYLGDLDFAAGIFVSGNIIADWGIPVYFYEFCYDGNINFCKQFFGIKGRKGACHADDLAYLFKVITTIYAKDIDNDVRSNIASIFSNFAKNGIPTINGSETQWSAFTRANPVYLSIDDKLTMKSNYEPKRMAAFKKIFEKYQM